MEPSREAAARPYGFRGPREVRDRGRVSHALSHTRSHTPSHNREFDDDGDDDSYRESLINATWSPEETDDLDGYRLEDIEELKKYCRSVGHAC